MTQREPRQAGEYSQLDMVTADYSARERIDSGRQFALHYLPQQYFALSEKKRDRRFVPLSDFTREPPSLPVYPVSVRDTVDSFSSMLADRRENSLPLSTVDYPALAYRPAQPLWSPDSEHYAPFADVSKDVLPAALRRSLQASAAVFDIVAYMKALAEAQVRALQSGLHEEDDDASFQASCEAMAQAASDAVALSTLALTNSTLHVRSKILNSTKASAEVKDRALRSQLVPDAWFGPAATSAVQEERRDPLLAARTIGGAISGVLAKATSCRVGTGRGSFRGSSQRGRGAGRGARQLFDQRPPFATRQRSRGRGRGRGAGRPSATATSTEH